jgi:beta-1,4-mannosyltransferase
MPNSRRVVHHPRRHPFVDRFSGPDDGIDAVDVWDVDALVACDVDAVHVHFGFEHITPDDMWAWCAALRRAGVALALTVHDIDNPHLVDQRPHHLRLAALVHHADELFTLTASAAAEIVARWGRHALVVPHPPIVPESMIDAVHRRPPTRRPVLVWLGALRPNVDLDVVVDIVERVDHPVEVLTRLDGWDALDDERQQRLIDAVGRSTSSELVITGRPDDDELIELVAHRPALVLPYAWGTHSGFVRMATDLGVPALVPTVGCHADQGALVAPADEFADLVAGVASGATAGALAVG